MKFKGEVVKGIVGVGVGGWGEWMGNCVPEKRLL